MSSTSKPMFKGSERNCCCTFTALGGELSERLEAWASGLSGLGWTGCWTSLLTWELPVWVTKGRHFIVPHGKSQKSFLLKAKFWHLHHWQIFQHQEKHCFSVTDILMLNKCCALQFSHKFSGSARLSHPLPHTAGIQTTPDEALSAL